MPNVVDTQIVEMRRVAQTLLTQSCTINRPNSDTRVGGSWTKDTTEVAAGVACRLAVTLTRVAGELMERQERVSKIDEYTLKVAFDQDIEANDEVVIGDDTYRVEALLDAQQWITVKRCKVTKVS